jgi:hypothetical protein
VRDPFVINAFESAELNVAEDELTEIRNNRRLKLKHSSTDMASFWLFLGQEYPIITNKAIEALLPFSISYLCEAGFSVMNMIKSKKRSQLQPSNLGQGTLCDITKHRFPTGTFMLAYIKTFHFYSCLYFKNFFLLSLFLLHSAYFPSTWPKTLRQIWLNLQVSIKKFTKNTILVKDR